MDKRIAQTRTRGDKTICVICGKDVTKSDCVKDADELFREMDGLFARMSKLFDKWWR